MISTVGVTVVPAEMPTTFLIRLTCRAAKRKAVRGGMFSLQRAVSPRVWAPCNYWKVLDASQHSGPPGEERSGGGG